MVRFNPDDDIRNLSRQGNLARLLLEKDRRGLINREVLQALALLGNIAAGEIYPEEYASGQKSRNNPVQLFFQKLFTTRVGESKVKPEQKIAIKCMWQLMKRHVNLDNILNQNFISAKYAIEAWMVSNKLSMSSSEEDNLYEAQRYVDRFLGSTMPHRDNSHHPFYALYGFLIGFRTFIYFANNPIEQIYTYQLGIAGDMDRSFENLAITVPNLSEELQKLALDNIELQPALISNPDENIRKLTRRGDAPVRELLEKERAGVITPSALKAAAIAGNEVALQLHEDVSFTNLSIGLLTRLFFFTLLNGGPGNRKLAFKFAWSAYKTLTGITNIETDTQLLSFPDFPQDSISYIESWLNSHYIDLHDWVAVTFPEDDLESVMSLVNGEAYAFTLSVHGYREEAEFSSDEIQATKKANALYAFLSAFRHILSLNVITFSEQRKLVLFDEICDDLETTLFYSIAYNLRMGIFWTLKDIPANASRAVTNQIRIFGDKIVDSALKL